MFQQFNRHNVFVDPLHWHPKVPGLCGAPYTPIGNVTAPIGLCAGSGLYRVKHDQNGQSGPFWGGGRILGHHQARLHQS